MNALPTGSRCGVDLFWLPLGAGDAPAVVRWSGRIYEAIVAGAARRDRCDLYHSALEVRLDGTRFVIEMGPSGTAGHTDETSCVRDRSAPGSWGTSGSSAMRCGAGERAASRTWTRLSHSPVRLSSDRLRARALLDLADAFPNSTWGRDEQGAGEMWNSNSLTSWLLVRSGHDLTNVRPPERGRAPGWHAGTVVARRAGTVVPLGAHG